jgi:hypothetical protein
VNNTFKEMLNSKKFKHLSKYYRKQVKKRIKYFYKAMKKNPDIAGDVRYYRIDNNYSWRMVAGYIGIKYPKLDIAMWSDDPENPSGHQPDGMWLCDAAMKYFKESVEDGW